MTDITLLELAEYERDHPEFFLVNYPVEKKIEYFRKVGDRRLQMYRSGS